MDNAKTILAMLLLLAAHSVAGDCIFTTEMERPEECIGVYECSETVGDIAGIVREWDCAKNKYRSICHSNYSYCQIAMAPVKEYWLKIRVVNASDNIYDIYSNIFVEAHHIVMMTLNNGNTTFIPTELYTLPKLTLLDFSRNKINAINLMATLKMEKLIVFNASFNFISELEKTSFESYRIGSNLTTIDLSHNVIKIIPDNCFSKFSNLLHLNMSYNTITSLSVLTFEGLAQLETLYLSNNNIQEIGMTLARFSYLKELTLDHNSISSIEETNFRMLTSLIKLNLSFNKILVIEDFSFEKMTNLKYLQLNYNNVTLISKLMFINNVELQKVDLSNNQINRIEPFSFRGTNITQCNFRNNALTILNYRSIFYGFKTKRLDLSVSSIKTLGEYVFFEIHSDLQSLNLSFNIISNVHENAFRDLELLTDLDLSNNKLLNLNFNMSDLKRLTIIKLENNLIKKISKDTFRNLKSLTNVNLSINSITEIELFSFKDLVAVEVLDLSNNNLPVVVAPYTFQGLSGTFELRLMHSKLTSLQDSAFFSLADLMYLNASDSNIRYLGYNVFNGTKIRTLDLSHNRLDVFNVNNSYLEQLEELYLNDNQIQHITCKTFNGLNTLKRINLDKNNILRIIANGFCSLSNISFLHVSSNPDMILDVSVFSNMTLREVKLQYVWKPFDFRDAMNISIEILDLSFSNITDFNSLMIYKIKDLETLLLKSNKIRFIDKYSFQNLSSLLFLDLSNNMISIIKPGSFAGTRQISLLNLYNNNLVSLIYGVFDGLSNLQVLNLSSNALHSFHGKLFHNSHKLSIVSLDDNLINNIDFHELHAAAIDKITIGGNMISCDFLVEAKKKHFYGVSVTSEKHNFHVENVDGISCKGSQIESSTKYNDTFEAGNTESTKIVDNSGNQHFRIINIQLDALKSAIYFEASCLLIILCLLLGVISFVYIKLRSKLVRSYNLSSQRRLTDSVFDMELSANS